MSQSMLAFDFGLRHIGTAVGNLQSGLATALGHIDAQDNGSRFAAIDALVSEWQPVQLVVGLPLALDGDGQAVPLAVGGFPLAALAAAIAVLVVSPCP